MSQFWTRPILCMLSLQSKSLNFFLRLHLIPSAWCVCSQRLAYRQNRQMLENAAREREAIEQPARGWAVLDQSVGPAVQNVHEGFPVVHHEAQVAGVGALANARPVQPARLLSVPPIAAFNLKRLCDVGPPDHPNDHKAFFNCICEVGQHHSLLEASAAKAAPTDRRRWRCK